MLTGSLINSLLSNSIKGAIVLSIVLSLSYGVSSIFKFTLGYFNDKQGAEAQTAIAKATSKSWVEEKKFRLDQLTLEMRKSKDLQERKEIHARFLKVLEEIHREL